MTTENGGALPDLAQALRRFNAGESWDSIGPDYGKTGNGIRKAVRRGQMRGRIEAQAAPARRNAADGVAWTETPNGATLESGKSGTIRTLDDLLAVCDVDLTRWQVARYVVNKWDTAMRGADGAAVTTQLYQVKAWLEPVRGLDDARALFAGLLTDLAGKAHEYTPIVYPPLADDDARHMAVISLADHHIGALSWGPETGESYDALIAEQLASEAMADILGKVSAWHPERILFILGNDLLHTDKTIDGKGGSTTKGTIQETDGRWQRTFRIATRVSIAAIDAARGIAPVDVHCKSGNHDTASMFMLGDVIDAWYRNDESVSVVNDPAPRTYVEYGVNMIGICHGHNEKPDKLPLLMATEAAGMWARTTFRDWMTGHRHRKGIVMSEESGVQIYTMPSLCAGDSWHVESGYAHRRSSEARIYHHSEGPAAHLIFNARRSSQ